jgi:hypothetical protein
MKTEELIIKDMKTLDKTIKKGIFTYNQLHRNENYAIYEQRMTELGTLVGHEVFRINKYPEREIMGNVIAAHEAMPGDNQFGVSAWSTGRDVEQGLS